MRFRKGAALALIEAKAAEQWALLSAGSPGKITAWDLAEGPVLRIGVSVKFQYRRRLCRQAHKCHWHFLVGLAVLTALPANATSKQRAQPKPAYGRAECSLVRS